jgi:hypothetical protein
MFALSLGLLSHDSCTWLLDVPNDTGCPHTSYVCLSSVRRVSDNWSKQCWVHWVTLSIPTVGDKLTSGHLYKCTLIRDVVGILKWHVLTRCNRHADVDEVLQDITLVKWRRWTIWFSHMKWSTARAATGHCVITCLQHVKITCGIALELASRSWQLRRTVTTRNMALFSSQ